MMSAARSNHHLSGASVARRVWPKSHAIVCRLKVKDHYFATGIKKKKKKGSCSGHEDQTGKRVFVCRVLTVLQVLQRCSDPLSCQL